MSKGRDFRGPKKRGFDDDGPSPYDAPRFPRTPRPAFGGTPFGAPAAPDMGGGAPAATVDAVVKWFKGDKGFGFVELANGAGDAFLHIGALQSAGYETVPPGAKLKVSVGNGMKGAQVTRVFEVDTSGAAERAPQRSFDSPRPHTARAGPGNSRLGGRQRQVVRREQGLRLRPGQRRRQGRIRPYLDPRPVGRAAPC